MEKNQNRRKGTDKGISLFLSIILVFCILAAVVFSVARKISAEMSASAIQNLSESLDLIEGTIEAILTKEAEFQKLVAEEIATIDDPEAFIQTYKKNQTMVKISIIMSGETEGVSNTGEVFTEEELDFSSGGTVEGLPVSQSYINYMGTWAYTIKCPVIKKEKELGTLYIEYVYDALDKSLPDDGFYNKRAMLYIMDAESERLVLKPKGIGERDAGHLNLEDFYRANNILEEDLRSEVENCLENGKNILFYHDIRGKDSLNYMWSVNGGTLYLIGYVPIEAIQQEGRAVNQNILIVVLVMLIAFILCCILYYFNQRQQNKIRKEQEKEREVYNKRLEEALQAAQIASNSKTTFLSNMSHDIRTPMNAIVGFTNLAITHIAHKELVEEYLKKIETSGNHLLSLINDVLDMSRIESGRMHLEETACSLPDILHGLCNILQADIHAKQLELHIDTVDVLDEEIFCDKLRLNQVLLNLVGNSVKYTGAGGTVSMRITEKVGASEGFANYEFLIKDTGIGMSEEFVAHIFEPFEREENTTMSGIQGTGLGMAITKNIVNMMNGTIEVKSKQNVGTEFIVSFTFRLNSAAKEPKQIPELKNSRVLVVDDDYNTCDSVSYMLQQLGMRAEWTLSGKEAVLRTHQAVTRNDDYCVYIVDWLLPDMNGIEVTRRIRKEVGENAPIIVLTAYDWSDIEEEAREAGVTSFCTKPLFLSELRNCLNSIVSIGEDGEGDRDEKVVPIHTGRILLAEDVDLNQEIAVAILGDAGFQIEVAGNGQIAVDMLKKSKPGYYQTILMDIQMPVMNGYEATKEIRKLENRELASIPIIAMTANAFEEDKREAIKSGMNGHIAKPIDVKELFRTLNSILGKL